jgi:hypothetical protein
MSKDVFGMLAEADPDAHLALTFVAHELIGHRRREGWTPEHDDEHGAAAFAAAGASYARRASIADVPNLHIMGAGYPPDFWPWETKWWKPKTAWRDLTRAAALTVQAMAVRMRKKCADYAAAVAQDDGSKQDIRNGD